MAARIGIAQAQTLAHADRIADGIDGKIKRLWAKILRLMASKPLPPDARTQIADLLRQVFFLTISGLSSGFHQLAKVSHARAVDELMTITPQAALNVALVGESEPQTGLQESRRLTEPQRRRVQAQLFPSLSADRVTQIVRQPTASLSWQGRIASISGLAPPDQLAALVIQGISQGQTVDRMARAIFPTVNGVRTSARRIARTEGMRVAHEARMDAYAGLGDLIIGYQIHATMDWRVRPHHAARNGTVYYRNPKPGQESMARMPRPPIEEDGSVAHNCRCYLTPVLDVDPDIENDPSAKALFTDNDHKLVPDPVTYDDWFQTASDQERRWAVGARRLAIVSRQLAPGESLTWAHFLDPKTGQLLSLDTLRKETESARDARVDMVNDVIAQRRDLAIQVSRFGYLAPVDKAAEDIETGLAPALVGTSPKIGQIGPAIASPAVTIPSNTTTGIPPAEPQPEPRPIPVDHPPVSMPSDLIGKTGWRLSRYLPASSGDGHAFELIGPTGSKVLASLKDATRILGLPISALPILRRLAIRAQAVGLNKNTRSNSVNIALNQSTTSLWKMLRGRR